MKGESLHATIERETRHVSMQKPPDWYNTTHPTYELNNLENENIVVNKLLLYVSFWQRSFR